LYDYQQVIDTLRAAYSHGSAEQRDNTAKEDWKVVERQQFLFNLCYYGAKDKPEQSLRIFIRFAIINSVRFRHHALYQTGHIAAEFGIGNYALRSRSESLCACL
jgi:hypothetical protein